MKRTLSLSREALASLTPDDLANVAGGAQTAQGATCPLVACATGILSDQCYTWRCQTNPC